jgi:hypothetical protein
MQARLAPYDPWWTDTIYGSPVSFVTGRCVSWNSSLEQIRSARGKSLFILDSVAP